MPNHLHLPFSFKEQLIRPLLGKKGSLNFIVNSLLANSISNDGDALFPAIAISPKAAINATLITTIPALILSYAYYFYNLI